ncbi:two-component sensor histidine kinase [Cystobacter fuscus DSM 2262]|uniref:histidine kinase n=1 Tax=Cystobacter fuscus (strain ATCC 25194 / DSM 2262 / NBRC 100088 / M29) TaxID=1242864 RepID=S9P0L0_CYSF2|nr:ATP-binding protein [Cystobacter fuscus]EPX57990.1 two-component sensor histidine kinase [Cystobacter fuscus DSM 2262]
MRVPDPEDSARAPSRTGRPLAVLMLEDSALDAELIQARLEDGGLKAHVVRVDTQEAFTAALGRERFDVILCDYSVPGFGGTDALATARQACPDTPFLFVSGALGEDRAIELLKSGATDYVLKDRLERLVPSVERALREAQGTLERERAEVALRQSEERYRLATLATSDAVWDWDLLTHVVQWNDAVETLFGYSREEIRQDVFWWEKAIHPEDRERVKRGIEIAVHSGARRWQEEFRFRRKDGRYTHVVDRGHVSHDASGRPVRMVGVMQDISAQKEVEAVLSRQARLGQLMADVGLALTRGTHRRDMLGRCVEALSRHLDAALARVWLLEESVELLVPEASAGTCAPPEELFGQVPLGAPLLVGRLARTHTPVVFTPPGEGAREAELEWVEREGLGGFVGHPLRVGNKTLGVVVVVARNPFTQGCLDTLHHAADSIALGLERLRAEEDAARLFAGEKAARTAAEEASRLKDEFLATVSHELRTPLTAMLGWVRLLRMGGLSGDKRERALETVERNARAQAQLIEDLLDVSRIMLGKLKLDVVPVEFSSVVAQALEVVRPAADAKNIQVRLVLDASCRVMGDAQRLQQVAWNLLANAVKFTPPSGQVWVEMARRGALVHLTVTDTGEGISPDFLPHVFERFRQADGSTTRRFGGLGLGLSIVRHLVEMHGGTVAVASEGVGRGATFTVDLPEASSSRRANTPLPGDTRLERARASESCPPELVGLHVLVVEEDADTRELLRTWLESCQARVSVAASAREALEALARLSPDVLLSDLEGPGGEGEALIRWVRSLPLEAGGGIPAAALTAFALAEDRTRVLRAGFNSHVPKPVDPLELFAVLASLSGRGGRGGAR